MALRLQAPTRGSRLAIVLTTVIVTTVVLVGGVALATVGRNSVGSPQIKNGSIKSVDIANGTVRAVDIANGTVSTADLKNDSVRGVDIRDGTIASADIADGSVSVDDLAPTLLRWAKVDADAAGAELLSGRGVASVARLGIGIYEVSFDDPVDGCGWIATLNENVGGIVGSGEIGVELESTAIPNDLFVRTWDSAGVPADLPSSDGFTVQVVC